MGMGSAALAAAAHYPGKATRISRKGQRGTQKTKGGGWGWGWRGGISGMLLSEIYTELCSPKRSYTDGFF